MRLIKIRPKVKPYTQSYHSCKVRELNPKGSMSEGGYDAPEMIRLLQAVWTFCSIDECNHTLSRKNTVNQELVKMQMFANLVEILQETGKHSNTVQGLVLFFQDVNLPCKEVKCLWVKCFSGFLKYVSAYPNSSAGIAERGKNSSHGVFPSGIPGMPLYTCQPLQKPKAEYSEGSPVL